MAMSAEQIQALASAVASWRMQEYIYIHLYCSYVYYVLSTVIEEVSIILPQRWNRGKMLYSIIRNGTLVFIALQLGRDYRNYFAISPKACKITLITADIVLYTVGLTCDFSLALCLSALLQAETIYLVTIVILSCGVPLASAVTRVVSSIQYPAEPVSLLDVELGYPCYIVPWTGGGPEKTVMYSGGYIRAYVNLVATIVLSLLGVMTFVARYKGQGSRLVQVIRRDGGINYLSLLVIRMVTAIIQTPAVIPSDVPMEVPELDASPVFVLVQVVNNTIIPILVQRLLINMRKVDYMGSEPVASKLLFAPPVPGSEGGLDGELESFEMAPQPSGLRHRAPGQGLRREEANISA
ncbi:hypothetical protein FA13DRAFT_1815724 [Coprinellus micaceus]|uniref:G-protein coupled receptors family 1 profile domain-containing protein n=1 Tax=Coprinellus micaceus TaxID=71717 RepID=A0A4Y7T4U3_COPMI|nr:hypothetical protein FA13DRAFT_1815724 [Coprinellus micaceus]